jgi:hypothetical protein
VAVLSSRNTQDKKTGYGSNVFSLINFTKNKQAMTTTDNTTTDLIKTTTDNLLAYIAERLQNDINFAKKRLQEYETDESSPNDYREIMRSHYEGALSQAEQSLHFIELMKKSDMAFFTNGRKD